MSNIRQDLDRIKDRISDPDFLANKGLSNEVGIHIFTYKPQDELIVREAIRQLVANPSPLYRVIERDLYQIFIEILEDKRILHLVSDLEEKRGKNYVFDQLQKVADPDTFLEKMKNVPHQRGDVLFVTGIGKIHPFMRAHRILESMQQAFRDIPVILFYPGTYNGQNLILFDKFHDGNYYRAFNLL